MPLWFCFGKKIHSVCWPLACGPSTVPYQLWSQSLEEIKGVLEEYHEKWSPCKNPERARGAVGLQLNHSIILAAMMIDICV